MASTTQDMQHITQAHTVINSRGGIWTKSVVRRRARLTINQNNEMNASISNSRYRLTYSNPSILNSRHRSTKTFLKKNCLSHEYARSAHSQN
jgi:hypothetical protein